jgi:site-specific DNA-methyltransferase (adenine-specific)
MVDAVITDPPYSERTHRGSDAVAGPDVSADGHDRKSLSYDPWGSAEVSAFCDSWLPRTTSWFCALTDDELITAWRAAFKRHDRQSFAAVPVLQHRPRLGGDGPGSGAVYAMVARPRAKRFAQWGSLPCWYKSKVERAEVMGAKPLEVMRWLVRDYSHPGDLIVDPCAGGATTLLAAAMEGRRAIGAEMDPETFAKAKRRLQAGYTPDMFSARGQPQESQLSQ